MIVLESSYNAIWSQPAPFLDARRLTVSAQVDF
jgi:hypothetical protein